MSTYYRALTLFPSEEVRPRVSDFVDLDELNGYAFLYTATNTGTATGIRFMATAADARMWCASDLSRGTMHGIEWAYFWTGVGTYLVNREGWIPAHGTPPDLTLPLDLGADNGQWDERIASSGCRMIRLARIGEVLAPLGVRVAYKGQRGLDGMADAAA